MAKKKRGRKMPKWKKWARAGVGIVGTVIGGLIVFSPTYRGLEVLAAGNVQGGIDAILTDTTGMSPGTGDFTPRVDRLVGTAITVGVGIGLMSLFRYFARRI